MLELSLVSNEAEEYFKLQQNEDASFKSTFEEAPFHSTLALRKL
jgi:hypothetical protein